MNKIKKDVEKTIEKYKNQLNDSLKSFSTKEKKGYKQEPIENLAEIIDHTILKPEATNLEIKKLCEEAKKFGFASVCVNSCNVKFVNELLQDSSVKVCSTISFPLGATSTLMKELEAKEAVANGADEIDMVINIALLKEGKYLEVKNDIERVVNAVKNKAIVKVILETSLLNEEEKIAACVLSSIAGADFVKTSTGFSTGGATIKDIELMRAVVGSEMGVKASGGVRDNEKARKMIKAGANRIGASSSIKIIQNLDK